MKAFIGQGNSAGAKARAAAATASMKEGGQRTVVDEEGDEGYGGGDGDEEEALPKQRLKGQTQKEQKVCFLRSVSWENERDGVRGRGVTGRETVCYVGYFVVCHATVPLIWYGGTMAV